MKLKSTLRAMALAALGFAGLAGLASCSSTAPPATRPVLVEISGYGRWIKATATTPDWFGFSVRAAEVCDPGPTTLASCPRRYPDTAFIDFSIPTFTSFEVSADNVILTDVGETGPMGDYRYRKVALTDGASGTRTWRIAVSVPDTVGTPPAARTWCPVTQFDLEIVNVSGTGTTPKSSPLPVTFYWGRCASQGGGGVFLWWSRPGSGSPAQTSPPAPTPDCPNGRNSRAFDVCERCGTSGLATAKTFWGCDLADANAKMGLGCPVTLRSGPNCP